MKINLNFENDIELYNRKTVDYGNGNLEIITYNTPRYKGGIRHSTITPKSEISDKAQEERTKKQLHAIKRRIKEYALTNSFQWFATLTINPSKINSHDYDKAKTTLLKWCRLLRDRYGKFNYLIIPELHKSGAVHFHALFSDIPADFIEARHPKTDKPIIRNNRQVYTLNDWKYGFSECENVDSPERTASYITKYMTKDLMTDKSMYRKKRYFISKGLKKPQISFEMKDNTELEKFTPNFGVIGTDSEGQNIVDVGIYKLATDKETGELIQTDMSYYLKAKTKGLPLVQQDITMTDTHK